MSGLQLALVSGALIGVGVALLIWRLVPAQAHLGDALDRLAPHRPTPAATPGRTRPEAEPAGIRGRTQTRLGQWALRSLPRPVLDQSPRRQLAMLEIDPTRFYGEKVLLGLAGLVAAPVITTVWGAVVIALPPAIPVLASLTAAVVLFFVPDLRVREKANQAEVEFRRALSAYIDLVALERNAYAGPRQALESAAAVGGDSWVFRRISQELARSRWSGMAPWDALGELADELGLPALREMADIVRLSGEESSQIYASLRARSASMRSALLSDELTKANEVANKMFVPTSLLVAVFACLLIAPSLLRVMGGDYGV